MLFGELKDCLAERIIVNEKLELSYVRHIYIREIKKHRKLHSSPSSHQPRITAPFPPVRFFCMCNHFPFVSRKLRAWYVHSLVMRCFFINLVVCHESIFILNDYESVSCFLILWFLNTISDFHCGTFYWDEHLWRWTLFIASDSNYIHEVSLQEGSLS